MDTAISPQHVFDATTATFESDVIEASRTTPILVDLWAEWCGPCKALGPVLEKVAQAYNGAFRLAKIDVDAEQQLAAAFQVRSIPTVILIKDGQPADGFAGALPEGEVKAFLARNGIEPLAEGANDEVVAAAPAVDPSLDPQARATALAEAVAADTDNADLQVEYLQALLAVGDIKQADAALEALPDAIKGDDRIVPLRARLALAQALVDAPQKSALEQTLAADPDNWDALEQLGLYQLLEGDDETALQTFLHLLEHARNWQDGKARERLLQAFHVIEDKALVAQYRRRMSSLLF